MPTVLSRRSESTDRTLRIPHRQPIAFKAIMNSLPVVGGWGVVFQRIIWASHVPEEQAVNIQKREAGAEPTSGDNTASCPGKPLCFASQELGGKLGSSRSAADGTLIRGCCRPHDV